LIRVAIERFGATVILRVRRSDLLLARYELDAYMTENASKPAPPPPAPVFGQPWPGVIAYLVVIVAMTFAVEDFTFGVNWVRLGQMDGGRLVDGEWWRAVTALTLHADAAHLLGNAVFGSFFGYWLGRSFGGGFAWALILVAGTAGNVLNGILSGPNHLSIGASTAVFAMLGTLTAYSWRRGAPPGTRERIAPIIAGLGLLAYTGVGGENTDIGAHLLGFVCGFGAGLGVARYGIPKAPHLQRLAAAAAVGILVLGWTAALIWGQ
jgi:rhomboid protease GluP